MNCNGYFRSARDLGPSDLIEVVLLVCPHGILKGKKEKRESLFLVWVVEIRSGGVKQRVIGLQLAKDSSTGLPYPVFMSPFFPLSYLNKFLIPLKQMHVNLS